MVETAPGQHKFKLSVFQPSEPKSFIKFVRKEVKLLRTSLPEGIHVKGFEDRMVNKTHVAMISSPIQKVFWQLSNCCLKTVWFCNMGLHLMYALINSFKSLCEKILLGFRPKAHIFQCQNAFTKIFRSFDFSTGSRYS